MSATPGCNGSEGVAFRCDGLLSSAVSDFSSELQRK